MQAQVRVVISGHARDSGIAVAAQNNANRTLLESSGNKLFKG